MCYNCGDLAKKGSNFCSKKCEREYLSMLNEDLQTEGEVCMESIHSKYGNPVNLKALNKDLIQMMKRSKHVPKMAGAEEEEIFFYILSTRLVNMGVLVRNHTVDDFWNAVATLKGRSKSDPFKELKAEIRKFLVRSVSNKK